MELSEQKSGRNFKNLDFDSGSNHGGCGNLDHHADPGKKQEKGIKVCSRGTGLFCIGVDSYKLSENSMGKDEISGNDRSFQ